jgi:hypothetical protein
MTYWPAHSYECAQEMENRRQQYADIIIYGADSSKSTLSISAMRL